MVKDINKFKGCLIGGAIGDALGYPVEFMKQDEIIKKYGDMGIAEYDLGKNGEALISDDTQMTLFTAYGILVGFTRACMRGIAGPVEGYVYMAYLDWLTTQGLKSPNQNLIHDTWLSKIPEMNHRRAPGNTCLSALQSGKMGTIEEPINNSKGCGSVMRVAPVGLYFKPNQGAFDLGMKTGAITHGNPFAYLSSGLLALIISKIVYEEEKDLEKIINTSLDYLVEFPDGIALINIIKEAINLSKQTITSVTAIKQLGEGWTAEEALSIAIYCSLKYRNDFKKGIIASVNHDGDSDSTGSITGNILGAYLGYNRIPPEYINNLELKDVIQEIAKDLESDIHLSEYGPNDSEDCKKWLKKY